MAINPVSLAVAAVMTGVNLLVNAMRTIEGPRLNDTSPVVADYGTPLNYCIGSRLLACPSFFAKPIREVRQENKGKGGKQVTYVGFGTWASHICDHEIVSVSKIWFDNHLVYDNTGSEERIYPLGDGYDVEASMRIYYGTEDQEADPDMRAYIEARDGPGTCPAYRPTAYVYFQDIPLEKLGNRYPTVTMLLCSKVGVPEPAGEETLLVDFENDQYAIGGLPVGINDIWMCDLEGRIDPGNGLKVRAMGPGDGGPGMDEIICQMTPTALAALKSGAYYPLRIQLDFSFEIELNAILSVLLVNFAWSSADFEQWRALTLNGDMDPSIIETEGPFDEGSDPLGSGSHSAVWTVELIDNGGEPAEQHIVTVGGQTLTLPPMPLLEPEVMEFWIQARIAEVAAGAFREVHLKRLTFSAGTA